MAIAVLRKPTLTKPSGSVSLSPRSQQSKGLIAWWPFSPFGGSTLFDMSGSGHHGTLEEFDSINSAWKPLSIGGHGLEFNNSVVRTTTNVPFGQISCFSLWVKPYQVANNQTLIGKTSGDLFQLDANEIRYWVGSTNSSSL